NEPHERGQHPLTHHQGAHVAVERAERYPYAYLSRAPGHRVAQDAEESNRRQYQRERREYAERERIEPRQRQQPGELRLDGGDLRWRELRVDVAYHPAQRRNHRRCIAAGTCYHQYRRGRVAAVRSWSGVFG